MDSYAEKMEELVDHSHVKVRADVVYDRLVAMGFGGDERTVRRAIAEAKACPTTPLATCLGPSRALGDTQEAKETQQRH